MNTSADFSDDMGGYCVTSELNGTEVALSQCMVDGTQGVTKAINKMYKQATTIPTIGFRWKMIEQGIQMEMRGMRMTAKAPAASAIVKREYGVRKGMSKAKTLLCWRMLMGLTGMMIEERGEEE